MTARLHTFVSDRLVEQAAAVRGRGGHSRSRPVPRALLFVSERLDPEVARFVERAAHLDHVVRVAVMPDVHLAGSACVGTVVATRRLLYPLLLGSDLGCGVSALPLGISRVTLDDPTRARSALCAIERAVPVLRRPSTSSALSPPRSPALARVFEKEGRHELGTIGRGNHFLELRSDAQDELWLVVHSGSRAMGPAVQHARHTALDADSHEGTRYVEELTWALGYARENRRLILAAACEAIGELVAIAPDLDRAIDCQHDSVLHEVHDGEPLWVHRKGAIALPEGARGVVPGSMGTATYLVRGRGDPRAMCSCAHGAGRAIPRGRARRSIDVRRLARELEGVVFDESKLHALVDEAPSAYKDVRAVMRAQRELVAIIGTLDPFVVHKGG